MKILSVILLVISVVCQTAYGASEEDTKKLKAYVEELIQEGSDLVNDKNLSEKERRVRSSAMIKSHLYLDWMAKYTLGRHRRAISEAQIKEFVKVYSLFVVKAYADLATNYKGEKAVLTHIKQIDDDLFIVNSEIVRPGSQSPIKVDYLVHKIEGSKKDPYLIGDIITEGISILNSQQSEFNSVISSHGVDWLIADLKKRAQSNANIAASAKPK